MTIFVLFIETRGVVSIPVENRFGVHSGNADLPRHTPSETAEQLYDWRGGGGGWGTVSDSILGGTRHFFFIILKILAGTYTSPPVPLLRGPWP